MVEEEKQQQQSVTGEKVEDMTQDYLAAIKELKEKSVDRSKYDDLRAENKRLLESLVNGQTVEMKQEKQEPKIEDLRKNLFEVGEQSNLEYVKNALALRKALMEKGEQDPFLPTGSKTLPTDEDARTAERVATVLQECVDASDGDSALFTAELQRRTVDAGIIRKRK